jgi:capsular polysaccharide biosynthesis protein
VSVVQAEKPRNFAPNGNTGPRLTVVQAIQRNLPLFLVPIVVLAGLAVAIAKIREPVYSSDAQINVGGVNLTTQSIPGYTVAVAQLAVAYSRSVNAVPVVKSVAKRAGITPADVPTRVSAIPIEQTPVVRIRATGSTAQEARTIADATADALVRYAKRLNRTNPDTPRLLSRFVADSRRLRAATARVDNAKSRTERERAQTAADLALLQQRTDAVLYGQSVAGDAATSLVQKLAPASIAKSDRSSVFQRLLLGAIIAGALIGAGLALMSAHADSRRRLVRP